MKEANALARIEVLCMYAERYAIDAENAGSRVYWAIVAERMRRIHQNTEATRRVTAIRTRSQQPRWEQCWEQLPLPIVASE